MSSRNNLLSKETTPVNQSEVPLCLSPESAKSAAKIIDNTIKSAELLPEDHHDDRLIRLSVAVGASQLKRAVASDSLEAFLQNVPAAKVLSDRMKKESSKLLSPDTFDFDDPNISLVAEGIGITADITQDAELLKQLTNLLKDASSSEASLYLKACKHALQTDKPFIVALSEVKAGKATSAIVVTQETYDLSDYFTTDHRPIPYPANDSHINSAWVKQRSKPINLYSNEV